MVAKNILLHFVV